MSAEKVTTADVVAMLFEIGAEKRKEQAAACFVRNCTKHSPHPSIWRRTESSSDR